MAKEIIISTWKWGVAANEKAAQVLKSGHSSLDAVEQGVRVSEDDPNVMTVGYGSFPDATGKITLDASIMDNHGNAGAVSFLEGIKNPISVARLVMEKTPHVMLSGDGAKKFALENGFTETNLHTTRSIAAYEQWLKAGKPTDPMEAGVVKDNWRKWKAEPQDTEKPHDTISMLALDAKGNLAGACTTSGLEFKMRGRVGDSPIIGAGLYVNGNDGAAAATGDGELSMKICGSFLVTELMRSGLSPREACKKACERIVEKVPIDKQEGLQMCFIALDGNGNYGSFSLRKGFKYALSIDGTTTLNDSEFLLAEGATLSANHKS
jgi:N4-(beta-N-acetylglucosaminyl)-L-asparaginase